MKIVDKNGKELDPKDLKPSKKPIKVFPQSKANRQFNQLKPIDKKIIYKVVDAIHRRRGAKFPGL
jgi:hypothetical protein